MWVCIAHRCEHASDVLLIPCTLALISASQFLQPGISTTQHRDFFDYWRFGLVVNALAWINVVALRQTRLVLRWVTVCGWVNHFGM